MRVQISHETGGFTASRSKGILFLLLSATLTFGLGGCANQLDVTYTCSPDGASLIQSDGRALGQCPLQVQYPVTSQDRSRGYVLLEGVTSNWVSGAKASVASITAYLSNGVTQTFHFERPGDVPDVALDNQFAVQFDETLRAQQKASEQAQAAQDQAALNALWSALAATARARAQSDQATIQTLQQNQPKTSRTNCGWVFGQWQCTTTTY
jgi:hypothetical protein